MSAPANQPAPDQRVLDFTTSFPPALVADGLMGTLVAWVDPQSRICIATDQSDPPFQAAVVNPDWTSQDTPALALAAEWGRIYLAWVDQTGAIQLASSAHGWTESVVVAPAGSSDSGPTLAFDGNTIYVAWTTRDSRLSMATCDANGNVGWRPTEPPLSAPLPKMNAERYTGPHTRAKAHCPDPTTVWDPSREKCVSRTGCWGACVLNSYVSVKGVGSLFNPVAYAVCVASCKD